MKFMQKGGDEPKEEVEIKKVKDSSEWSLPTSSKIISSTKPITVVETVGYASINTYSTNDAPVESARKTWGAPKVESKEEQEAQGLNISKLKDAVNSKKKRRASSVAEGQSKEFLRNLWDKKQLSETAPEEPVPSNKRKGDYIPNVKLKQKKK